MAQTVRIQVPGEGTFTCSSSTAEEAVEYLGQVLDEPWHGQKVLSCGPRKLKPQDILHDFTDDFVLTNYSHLSSGPPISIPRTEERGISIEQLSRLLDFVRQRVHLTWYVPFESFDVHYDLADYHYGQPLNFEHFNQYHMLFWVLKPATASPWECSYVELVASKAASQRPVWYVTYVWQQPFYEIMACLRRHASLRELPESTAYWVDALANNHHRLDEDICDNPRKESFCKAMKLCAGLLLVCDNDVVVMSRIWVCFEVALALEERNKSLEVQKRNKWKSGKHFLLDVAATDPFGDAHLITDGLAAAEERMERALGFLFKGQREAKFPETIRRQAASVDITQADATQYADKVRILNSLRLPQAKTRDLDDRSLIRDDDPCFRAFGDAIGEKMAEADRLSSVAQDLSHFLNENKKQTDQVEKLVQDMDDELWNEQDDTVQKFLQKFESAGWTKNSVEQKVQEIRALHSYHAGVSMAYLLHDFVHLARQRSEAVDPTFLQLKEVFWCCEDKIGQGLYCPRDGKLGRALVDLLPPNHRQRQNHFMSWSWQYSLGQVTNALQMWKAPMAAENVFFYMCFFVNNQFRLIVDGSPAGSDNLEEVFEENLRRCGQMVAILDGWHQPRYLRRVWTIYEQYMACVLKIDVAFAMPHETWICWTWFVLPLVNPPEVEIGRWMKQWRMIGKSSFMGKNHIELGVILQPPCTTNRTSNANFSVVCMVSFPPAWSHGPGSKCLPLPKDFSWR